MKGGVGRGGEERMRFSKGALAVFCVILVLHYVVQQYLQKFFHQQSSSSSSEVTEDVEMLIRSFETSLAEEHKQEEGLEKCSGSGEQALVTFIVPTMFRASLIDALSSLQKQTSCRWEAVVVYQTSRLYEDSDTKNRISMEPLEHLQVLPRHILGDLRIQYLESTASAEVNFAGNMRNEALMHIGRHSDQWIAFLDDDDTLLPHYVSSLQQEAELNPSAKVILFRMLCSTCYTQMIPPHNHLNLVRSYSGISFAVKNELLTQDEEKKTFPLYSFPSGANEDYCLLYNIRNGGHTIVMSPTITYLVKGPQPSYLPELEKTRWGLQSGINRSVITAQPGTYRSECIQKQLPQDVQTSSNSHLGFNFPEAGHYIFQQNIAGLQHALSQANQAGCLIPWLLRRLNVEIHFSYLTPIPKGRHYIQIQMEQIHSRKNMFSKNYVQKLKSALQVWTIAPTHYTFVKQYLQIPQTYFVPLWHMIDPDTSLEHTCRNQSVVPKQAIVKRVVNNIPFSSYTKNRLLEDCLILPEYSSSEDEKLVRNQISKSDKKLKKKSPSYLTTPFCDIPRVVLYGALIDSDNDRRLKLCVALKEALPASISMECFHELYGPSLDRVLCAADIILVDRFYSSGSVESHRIDPLLKMGKIVISTASQDLNMQQLYKDAIVFTTGFDDLVEKIKELLGKDIVDLREQGKNAKKFIESKVSALEDKH